MPASSDATAAAKPAESAAAAAEPTEPPADSPEAPTEAAPVPATYHVGFHAANSNVVLAWKYADRIAGLSVSPTAVNRNGRLTVKGTLQYYNSGWRTYAGQTILIVLEPAGGSTWYWIVKVRTNAQGQFAATVADPVTAHWGAYFDGNSTHLSVQAGNTYVRVR